MSFKTTPELWGDALDRARHQWRRLRREPVDLPPPPPRPVAFTIAFSRQEGARGTEVAQEVARQLDWVYYDRGLLEKIAEEANLRSELLESVDERYSNWLTDIFESLAGRRALSGTYYEHLVKVLYSVAAHGQCVILGRGATFLLPMESTLRVRLVAPFKDRAARAASRANLSPADAAAQVESLDRQRDQFVQNYCQKDAADAAHYDLVLNTSRYGNTDCAQLVIDAQRRLQAAAVNA